MTQIFDIETRGAANNDDRGNGLFCTECGTRNSADSKYCKECGYPINAGYRTLMQSIEGDLEIDDAGRQRVKKLLDMAFWHHESGNPDAAVIACEAALTIQPNCTTAHSLLGILCEKSGDDAGAVEHFESVVRLNPDSAADAAKLDQLRRGVHVKAVAAPAAYRWLPPALAGVRWDLSRLGLRASVQDEKQTAHPKTADPKKARNMTPLAAAVTAGAAVLVIGIAVLRPSGTTSGAVRQETHPAAPVTTATLAPAAGSGLTAADALPAPIYLKPGTNRPVTITPVAPGTPDPFSETLPNGASAFPLYPAVHAPHTARSASGRTAVEAAALPPLSLHAVPMARDGDLPPAAVALDAPSARSRSYLPQHTVVVSDLGDGRTAQPVTVSDASPQADPGNGLASHIKISIDNSPDSGSVTISDHGGSTPPRVTGDDSASSGDGYQQSALALQQNGDYGRAQAAYQKAIRAYKSQIASGHNADAAAQGLAASQTGLQICVQSQR